MIDIGSKEIAIRLLLALIIGGIIGLEREKIDSLQDLGHIY